MEITIMGAVLGLISIAYTTLSSWALGQIHYAPAHLAFSLACGITLIAAALCGLFSKTQWQFFAFAGIILFGSLGVLLAMPTITMTMLAIDQKDEECKICVVEPLECNRLCRDYKAIHIALLLLTLVVHVAGSILWSSTCRAIFRQVEKARIAAQRRVRRMESDASYNSNNSIVSAEESEATSEV